MFDQTILQRFIPVSLNEMDAAELLDRTDTKYVIHANLLPAILENLSNDYRILEVNGMRPCRYESLYYDYDDFAFYKMHHNGKGNRIKVRYRHYETTDKCFFEVKRKTNKGRTIKKRIPSESLETEMNADQKLFFEKWTHLNPALLKPSVETDFTRITLVKKDFSERVTFDFQLCFKYSDSVKNFNNIVIAEVKQSRYDYNSPVIKFLKLKHIIPRSISKYCWGVISLNESVKSNMFKKQLLEINKMLIKTEQL